MANAQEFVEKFYTDDEFLKEFYKNGGLNKDATDVEKMNLIINTANKMGFIFNKEEFKVANTKYFEGKNVFFAIKTFRHLNKLAKTAEKEMKKNI